MSRGHQPRLLYSGEGFGQEYSQVGWIVEFVIFQTHRTLDAWSSRRYFAKLKYIISREAESVNLLAHKYCTRNFPLPLTLAMPDVLLDYFFRTGIDHVVYSKILVTRPVATVRPPSRMLNRWPVSMTWG